MSHAHPFLIGLALALSGSALPAHGAEPAPRWRLSTEADLPPGAVVRDPAAAPTVMPAPAVPATSSGMRVSIDPITNEIIESPTLAPLPARTPTAPSPDFSLQRTPEGYLYIDTTALQNVQVLHIDADGSMHANCYLPGHSHAGDPAADDGDVSAHSEQTERRP
jgi:hypothetical protein